jgi:hypothetical protein
MHINNYQGTVADRPINTPVIQPPIESQQLPAQRHGFMNNVLSRLANQGNAISAGNLPIYDKG